MMWRLLSKLNKGNTLNHTKYSSGLKEVQYDEDYTFFNSKEDEREALQELSYSLHEFTAEQSYRFE